MVRRLILLLSALLGLLFIGITGEDSADPSTQLEQAETYMKNGQYHQAEGIYQQILADFPGTDYAFKAQKNLVIVYITMDMQTEAETALQQLLANFSTHKDIAKAVHNIAYRYQRSDKYETANELYQYVLNNWPESEHAMWSQMDLAKLNIELGNDALAEAAIDKLLTDFSGNERIAKAVHNVAYHCQKFKKYETANQLYQYVLANWPESEHAMWSQMDLAKLNIGLGNDALAQVAIDKLLTDFSGNERIAKAVHNVAYHCQKFKKYETANQLYQYVLDNWPEAEHAMWSQMDLAKLNIGLGNESVGQAALDKLIADFNDHPGLALALWRAAEAYYNEAFRYQSEGRDEQAKDYFQKVITSGERILQEMPASDTAAEACYILAVCYERLGEHADAIEYYQRVVDHWPDFEYTWHALFRIGCGYEKLKKSGLMDELGADEIIRAVYEQLLEEYPTCIVATHTRAWLSRHQPVN